MPHALLVTSSDIAYVIPKAYDDTGFARKTDLRISETCQIQTLLWSLAPTAISCQTNCFSGGPILVLASRCHLGLVLACNDRSPFLDQLRHVAEWAPLEAALLG